MTHSHPSIPFYNKQPLAASIDRGVLISVTWGRDQLEKNLTGFFYSTSSSNSVLLSDKGELSRERVICSRNPFLEGLRFPRFFKDSNKEVVIFPVSFLIVSEESFSPFSNQRTAA